MSLLVTLIILAIIVFFIIAFYESQSESTAEEKLIASGFNIDRKLECKNIGGGLASDKLFCIDDKNKKFAIIPFGDFPGELYVFYFKELIDFELKEDGNSIIKGSALSSALYGAVTGIKGAIVGAAGSRKTQGTCTSLNVLLYIDNLKMTNQKIVFINSEVKKNSTKYKDISENAFELISVLKYIQNKN